MEPSLKEITVLSGSDVTASLDTIATRPSNQLTRQVSCVGSRTVPTNWPRQQITNVPARKQVSHWISACPEQKEGGEDNRAGPYMFICQWHCLLINIHIEDKLM